MSSVCVDVSLIIATTDLVGKFGVKMNVLLS